MDDSANEASTRCAVLVCVGARGSAGGYQPATAAAAAAAAARLRVVHLPGSIPARRSHLRMPTWWRCCALAGLLFALQQAAVRH